MARTQVLYTDQLDRTLDKLAHGGLLLASTRSDGRSNVMTIGWATMGVVWGLPMLVVMIRPSRYTYEFVEESRVFTVNVPAPEMSDYVTLCGTRSGREVDKLAQVATSAAQTIDGVTIDGCPLVYECKVVHWDDLTPDHLLPDVRQRAYPRGDFHRLYYGQILGVFAG
ncbi:MAG: flavin reductase family protein [Anaerolineae bacterium]|nr:flavin reductase family protein [Anaerolineae bacterium]